MIMDRGQEIEFAADAAIDGLCGLEGFDKTDMCNMFASGVTWADAHPKNPWISVKDKLPEENRKVFFILLFRGIHKEYLAGLYREHKWETERRTYLSPSFDGIVTHWMPIPELNVEPKE